MCRPPRLECKNPRRNAAVYHAKRLGFFRDWISKNAVFRCSRYVALPAIIPHCRGEGERFVYSGYGDVGYSVSREPFKQNGVFAERVGKVVTITICTGDLSISDNWGTANVCILPWKPTFTVYFAVILQEGLSGVIGMVKKDGSLVIQGKSTQWRHGWLFGSVSYICA